MTMLTVTSFDEKNFINDNAIAKYSWLGLEFVNGNWTWIEDTSVTYTYWQTWKGNGRCAKLHKWGYWYYAECDDKMPAICERPLGEDTTQVLLSNVKGNSRL